MNKKVSIITPVKNLIKDAKKEKLIACLKSIKEQTHTDIEHLIIEGGSDDETLAFLEDLKKDFSFRLLSQKDNCIAEALTYGVNEASGDWIMFLNASDVFMSPDAVEKTVELAQNENVDFVYGDSKCIRNDNKTESLPECAESFFRILPFYLQSICIKASLAKRLMPFDNKLELINSSVYDFILKIFLSKAIGVKNTQVVSLIFIRLPKLDWIEKIKEETITVIRKYFICPPNILENMIYKAVVDLNFYSFVIDKIAPVMREKFEKKFHEVINRLACIPKYAAEGYKRLYMPLQGIGDALIFSSVARAICLATGHKVLVGTKHKDLFENNPYVETTDIIHDSPLVVSEGLVENIKECGIELIHPSYWLVHQKTDGQYDVTYPNRHMIAQTAMRSGFTGEVDLKPEMYLTDEEKEFGRFARPWRKQIAIMSTATEGQKQWNHFQETVEILKQDYDIVQVGAKGDKILDGVTFQKAGELTLRQTASVLYNSDVFVGEIGGLMHMARAVDCPAVIAYSAAEPDYFSSYIANKNIGPAFECKLPNQKGVLSACNHCPYERRCVNEISLNDMVDAIRSVLSGDKQKLPFKTVYVKANLLPDSIQEHFARYKALYASRK